MSKQVWGTFSVKDHCDPNAFVAEVMLYDLVVKVGIVKEHSKERTLTNSMVNHTFKEGNEICCAD